MKYFFIILVMAGTVMAPSGVAGQKLDDLRARANAGDAEAQLELGSRYADGKDPGLHQDYAEASRWYRKSAEQGNHNAQQQLGLLYWQGHGVIADMKEALVWLRKAAEAGLIDAQYQVGVIYVTGKGVPKDRKEAYHWFRRAAFNRDGGSQAMLGVMYANGEGVPKDPVEGLSWLSLAAATGYPIADNCERLQRTLTPEQVSLARARSDELRARLASIKPPRMKESQEGSIAIMDRRSEDPNRIEFAGASFTLPGDGWRVERTLKQIDCVRSSGPGRSQTLSVWAVIYPESLRELSIQQHAENMFRLERQKARDPASTWSFGSESEGLLGGKKCPVMPFAVAVKQSQLLRGAGIFALYFPAGYSEERRFFCIMGLDIHPDKEPDMRTNDNLLEYFVSSFELTNKRPQNSQSQNSSE